MLFQRSWGLTDNYAGVIFGIVAGVLLLTLALTVWICHRRCKKQGGGRNPGRTEEAAQLSNLPGRRLRKKIPTANSEITLSEAQGRSTIDGEPESVTGNNERGDTRVIPVESSVDPGTVV